MNNKGWIKLHRQILENVFLMNDDTAFIVFTKLLLLSNSKGEIGLSGRKLAKRLNLNYSTVYKCLNRLEEEAVIKQLSKHKYTVIYICNWGNYQETGKHYGKQMVSMREADGKRLTGVPRIENKNKEIVNVNSEGYKIAKQARDRLKGQTAL